MRASLAILTSSWGHLRPSWPTLGPSSVPLSGSCPILPSTSAALPPIRRRRLPILALSSTIFVPCSLYVRQRTTTHRKTQGSTHPACNLGRIFGHPDAILGSYPTMLAHHGAVFGPSWAILPAAGTSWRRRGVVSACRRS